MNFQAFPMDKQTFSLTASSCKYLRQQKFPPPSPRPPNLSPPKGVVTLNEYHPTEYCVDPFCTKNGYGMCFIHWKGYRKMNKQGRILIYDFGMEKDQVLSQVQLELGLQGQKKLNKVD